jgi:hypothetical protein
MIFVPVGILAFEKTWFFVVNIDWYKQLENPSMARQKFFHFNRFVDKRAISSKPKKKILNTHWKPQISECLKLIEKRNFNNSINTQTTSSITDHYPGSQVNAGGIRRDLLQFWRRAIATYASLSL